MSGDTRALVLSGGGTAGGAWMLGIIRALREEGVDLGGADLIVGTSAGARTGAALAAGGLDQAVAMYQRSQVPPLEVPVALEEFMAAVLRVMAETPGRQEAVRRIASFAPLGSSLVPEDDRSRMVAAHLPADAWPDTRLAVVAALPGVFPLVTISGTRYADGGVHSPYNAGLAAGHDVVVVLSPVAPHPDLQALPDAGAAALAPATVHIIAADGASLTGSAPTRSPRKRQRPRWPPAHCKPAVNSTTSRQSGIPGRASIRSKQPGRLTPGSPERKITICVNSRCTCSCRSTDPPLATTASDEVSGRHCAAASSAAWA